MSLMNESIDLKIYSLKSFSTPIYNDFYYIKHKINKLNNSSDHSKIFLNRPTNNLNIFHKNAGPNMPDHTHHFPSKHINTKNSI